MLGKCLNGVRPRRPEQSHGQKDAYALARKVSMESGLEDRNNAAACAVRTCRSSGLNGVRPRRPEQFSTTSTRSCGFSRLNGVRPRRPEQSGAAGFTSLRNSTVSMESGLEDRNNHQTNPSRQALDHVSMESGLEDRNNISLSVPPDTGQWSQWSPA